MDAAAEGRLGAARVAGLVARVLFVTGVWLALNAAAPAHVAAMSNEDGEAATLAAAAPPAAATAPEDLAPTDVEALAREAQQILRASCLECHDARKARADLRLDDREHALAGGDSGLPAIVPGEPTLSELIQRVTTQDLLDRMPPDDRVPLDAEQVAQLERWIQAGAPWPTQDTQHWAFRAPRATPAPTVQNVAWLRDPLDAYVLAELEAAGLQPNPEADAATLARRLSLDLVGLPPAPADVDALAADPGFYDIYVDRLLASPHFAERWARHWLDKAGYADSDGYENDKARPEAYHWRDWVLQSMQRDQPYDEFLREQIAGDLLPDANAGTRIATGFFRQTLTNTEAGVDKEEFRLEAVMQRVDLTGTALLGLTVNCARCHDHKYDPISANEYYALAAFFDNADESVVELPAKAEELAEYKAALAVQRSELGSLREELGRAYERFLPTRPRVHPLLVDGANAQGRVNAPVDSDGQITLVVTQRPERCDGFAVELFDAPSEVEVIGLSARVGSRVLELEALPVVDAGITSTSYRHASWRLAETLLAGADAPLTLTLSVRGPVNDLRVSAFTGAALDAELPARIRKILATPLDARNAAQTTTLAVHDAQFDDDLLSAIKALKHHRRSAPENPVPSVPVLAERRVDRRVTRLLERGDHLRAGETVSADTPAVLPALTVSGERPTRLDLARWLAAPEHPLTARVFVNDVWQQLFGEGLVRTPGDFGTRGAPPTHPALLDQLAIDTRDSGWSRKALIRRLVRSATYRQASTHRPAVERVDPENKLLHRQSRTRVDAELVRDQALAVSGLLSETVGGPSVFPPLPDGVADKSYANLFRWSTSEGEDRYRRGLYTFFKRTAPHPHLEQFDAPTSLTSCVRRGRSNTPLQALITLNDPLFVEAAAHLAARVMPSADTDDARLTEAFRLCIAREPTRVESTELLALLDEARSWYLEHPNHTAVLVGSDDSEHAAWTTTLRVLLNLDEFLVRP
ncbi:MAG: hypothetical protein DHS20C15_31020 [Planctomycetota bacterium]|nr:MAG: hypothetical protein DHS20C15_31020 [Planctomycetota bacterium]